MLTAGEQAHEQQPPRLVGLVWFLLMVNTLGFTTVEALIPLPRNVFQVVTMGALAVAFVLALVLNPRVRVRPSAYLLLLSLLVLVGIGAGLQFESGLGALLRSFRFTLFVATLWLLSCWWTGGVAFARIHVRALSAILLTVLLGLVITPGGAFSGPDGRLVGAIWPIPAPQVGLYCALVIGLSVILWLTRRIAAASTLVICVPAAGMLLLSHTRTALLGLVVGLLLAALSVAARSRRARRAVGYLIGVGGAVALLFGATISSWLQRGQDSEELTNLTGRTKVWDLLLAKDRTVQEQIFGVGLTDKTYAGLPIDSTWMSVYHELGWIGITIVVAFLAALLAAAALRPPSPERACAVFLIVYCIIASYTEVGLGDASPYLLALALAAALLVPQPPAPPALDRFPVAGTRAVR